MLDGWSELLRAMASEARTTLGGLGPFEPADIAALTEAVFLGAEAAILLGREEQGVPHRRALRTLGTVIRALEEGGRT